MCTLQERNLAGKTPISIHSYSFTHFFPSRVVVSSILWFRLITRHVSPRCLSEITIFGTTPQNDKMCFLGIFVVLSAWIAGISLRNFPSLTWDELWPATSRCHWNDGNDDFGVSQNRLIMSYLIVFPVNWCKFIPTSWFNHHFQVAPGQLHGCPAASTWTDQWELCLAQATHGKWWLVTFGDLPGMSGDVRYFFWPTKAMVFLWFTKAHIFFSCIDARPIHTSIQHSYLSSYLMLSIYYIYLGKCKHTHTSTHTLLRLIWWWWE